MLLLLVAAVLAVPAALVLDRLIDRWLVLIEAQKVLRHSPW